MKNYRRYKNKVAAAVTAALMIGCTSDFEEINTNPNDPVVVPTSYLLTQAQRNTLAQQSYFTTNLYAQLFAETQYTNTSRYETEQASFDGFYQGPLADLQEIIDLNTDESTSASAEVLSSGSNNNQLAVARILKAYNFQILTDTWGDIPYKDALLGMGNLSPTYTPQSEIYTDLVSELKTAAAQIEPDAAGVEGDVIYGGDMDLWKKFANSLLLRVGIRMSDANPDLAKDAITSALAGGVFTSNDEGAVFTYLTASVNSNPIYSHFHVSNRTDYAVSNVLVNFMKSVSDPRLSIYANPTENSVEAGTPEYVGELYGVTQAQAGATTNASISFLGDYWKETPEAAIIILSYSEVLFIQSEAAVRGWIVGDAEEFYNEAIKASMNYYGITDQDDIDNYINQTGVKFDAANYKKYIGEQKWVSLYAVGHEPWSEWRRLEYPVLSPAPAAVEGRSIPLRLTYATREYTLNAENVNEAVKRQAASATLHMSDAVWWDE
jgi:hypothetical protein